MLVLDAVVGGRRHSVPLLEEGVEFDVVLLQQLDLVAKQLVFGSHGCGVAVEELRFQFRPAFLPGHRLLAFELAHFLLELALFCAQRFLVELREL